MKYLKQYSATWCSPCRQLSATLEQLNFPENDIDLEKIDIDELEKEQLRVLGIRGVPTMVLYDEDGDELSRQNGNLSLSDVKQWLGIGLDKQ